MIQLSFSAEEIEQLHDERFHYPHPRVQQKMERCISKVKGIHIRKLLG
ncbi:hypothetical protein HC928_13380 [bacterium]|nr:hypothetical protein [bacterium]